MTEDCSGIKSLLVKQIRLTASSSIFTRLVALPIQKKSKQRLRILMPAYRLLATFATLLLADGTGPRARRERGPYDPCRHADGGIYGRLRQKRNVYLLFLPFAAWLCKHTWVKTYTKSTSAPQKIKDSLEF